MKSEIKTEFQVTLTLNAREATWLKTMTQNYILEGEEPQDERSIRKSIFDALPSFSYLEDVGSRVLPVQDHFPVPQVDPMDEHLFSDPVARVPARKIDDRDLT